MSQTELEVFRLYEKLAELLGDSEAVADLKRLYEHHPEMFENMGDVARTISEVVKTPDLIADAKRAGAILAAKKLSDEKMGEVAIENDSGTNIIFHANKKKVSEFNRLIRNTRLSVETPSAKAAPTWQSRCADKPNDLSKCDNTHSTIATATIPQTQSDKLSDKKMGEVVVANDNGTNVIFHANKKNVKEFYRLEGQVETGGRVAHFLHPDIKSAWADANAHSPAKETISQTHGDNDQANDLKEKVKAFAKNLKPKANGNEMER